MGNKKILQGGFRNPFLNHTCEQMWEGACFRRRCISYEFTA